MAVRLNLSNASGDTTATGATKYYPVIEGRLLGQATEAFAQTKQKAAGTFSYLTVRVITNATSSPSTLTFRKNGSDVTQTITIPTGTTGEFQDTSNSDAISVDDLIGYKIVNGGGGNLTLSSVSVLFTPSGNINKRHGNSLSVVTFDVNTRYASPSGIGSFNATEAAAKQIVKTAGTLKNLQVNVTTNSRTSDTIVGIRKNTANGNQSITIGAGITGILEDTSNTDALVVDDLFNFYVTTGEGSSEEIDFFISVEYETTNNTFQFLEGSVVGATIGTGVNTFLPLGGQLGASTTEANTQAMSNQIVTLSKLAILIVTNTTTSDSTIKTRINGANGGQTITIPAGTTGTFVDSSGTDAVVATDEINLNVINGGGGNLTFGNVGLVGTLPTPPFGSMVASIRFAGELKTV